MHLWPIPAQVAFNKLRTFRLTLTSTELLDNLAYGEKQQGVSLSSSQEPLVIGWGGRSWCVCQAKPKKALNLFPDAWLLWFSYSGRFPQLGIPDEAARLILDVTNRTYQPLTSQLPKQTAALKAKQPENVLIGVRIAAIITGIFFAFHPPFGRKF